MSIQHLYKTNVNNVNTASYYYNFIFLVTENQNQRDL